MSRSESVDHVWSSLVTKRLVYCTSFSLIKMFIITCWKSATVVVLVYVLEYHYFHVGRHVLFHIMKLVREASHQNVFSHHCASSFKCCLDVFVFCIISR